VVERLLTLVRHGRTHANAANLLQGHIDNELDEVGLSQATLLGDALQRIAPVTRLISSPLKRAQQTASAIRTTVGHVNIETHHSWIELDYGDFDAQPVSTVPPEIWATWRSDPHFRPPNGETLAELDHRVRAALASLVDDDFDPETSEHIVVVSHVSPIKAAVAWALGVDMGVSWRTALDRASMSTIRLDATRPVLKSFNVTVHDID